MTRYGAGGIFLAGLWACVWTAAVAAAPLATGQWAVTARALTPQGEQTLHETVCQRGGQIDSLLMHQQGAQCAPWIAAGQPNAVGEQVFTAQCTQTQAVPGFVLPFSVEARVKIAPDGRRVSGSVVASSTINGVTLNSPATPFEARFLRPQCNAR